MKKIIILAAGKGKRMNGEIPKVLARLNGKPMIEYLIKSILKSGIDKTPIVVVSPDNQNAIKGALKKYNCQYAVQSKPLGTGHALLCAKNIIKENIRGIICFYGDHPLVKPQTIQILDKKHKGAITIMTTVVENFNGWQKNFYHWGRIVRYNNKIQEIVEFKDASEKVKKIKEVNPGFYCFNSDWLWKNISSLNNNNNQKEYYLTDLIELAFRKRLEINSLLINDPRETIGINNEEELKVAERLIT